MPDRPLKPGWTRVRFGDVVRLVTDRCDPVAAGIERFVGLEHLEPGDLRVRSWGNVADGTTFTNRFKPGHVLFGKRRAYQRKLAVADFEGVCSGDIYVFESKDPRRLLPELLPYLCQTDAFFEHAVGTSAGSLSPRTNWTSLSEYGFPLPSIAEQVRHIELLSSVLAVEESLRHASRTAQGAALAGCLAAMGVSARDRAGTLAVRLPRDWKLAELRRLALHGEQAVQVGPFGGSLASRHFTEFGVGVLKVQNVGHDGFIDHSNFIYVAEDYGAALERYKVRAGDMVVVAQGFTSGRVAIIREQDAGRVISQHLIRIRLDPQRISPAWLWCFMRSRLFEEQVAGTMMKTTRPGLNTGDILGLQVPVPSLKEQSYLAEGLARLLATPREIENRAQEMQVHRCALANRVLFSEARL